ncbi:MAG: hypothetical protein RLZZ618_1459 [Pseudomonadota bacterium]
MPKPGPTTIPAYIDAAPPEGQALLRQLYALLKSVAPKAEEAIKWGTPFFVEPRFLFAFSAHKAHLSFTPTEAQPTPVAPPPDTHAPGADDNASGVAGLIELAHLLGRTPQHRSIELVASTLEEPPHFRTEHMGSAWHARSLRASGRDVELMLRMDDGSVRTITQSADAAVGARVRIEHQKLVVVNAAG